MKAIFSSLVVLSLGVIVAVPASAANLEAIYKGTSLDTFTGPSGSTTTSGSFEADFYYNTTLGTVSSDDLTFTGLLSNEGAEYNGYFLGSENSFSTSIIKNPFTSTITSSISGLDGNLTVSLTALFPSVIPGSVEAPFGTATGSGSGSYYFPMTGFGPDTSESGTLSPTSVQVIDLSPPPPPVSTVPLPAGLPMFSMALLGLGALGYSLKRNGKAVLPA